MNFDFGTQLTKDGIHPKVDAIDIDGMLRTSCPANFSQFIILCESHHHRIDIIEVGLIAKVEILR